MTAPDGEATFLLKSMADLDEEYRAGDLDRADYEVLSDAYLQRAAAALADAPDTSRDVACQSSGGYPAHLAGYPPLDSATRIARPVTSWPRRLGILAGVLALAGGAGWMVARSAGQRLATDEATGSIRTIGSDRRDRIAAGLAAGQESLTSDPLGALRAYDSVLAEDPGNAEALTYSGWVLRLVALSATDEERAELFVGAGRRLDAAVAADGTYPDARALRAVHRLRDVNDRAGAAEDIAALDRGEIPPEIRALISGIRADLAEQPVTSASAISPVPTLPAPASAASSSSPTTAAA